MTQTNKTLRRLFLLTILAGLLAALTLAASAGYEDGADCWHCGHYHWDEYMCSCGACSTECTDADCWMETHCPGCGGCLAEIGDFCDDCGKCRDCMDSEGGHCSECMCPYDPEYEDHFCIDCGVCFHDVSLCDTCEGEGELRCTDCCAALTSSLYDCDDGICQYDTYFEDHLREEHDREDFEPNEHDPVPENRFSHDAKNHYHACRYCDEDEDEAQALAHRTGVAAHSYNANGVCVTCGYSAGGKLYIAKQPRDVRCKTSIYDGYDEDPANGLLYMENHPVTFTVTVKGGKGNYHYQWYRGKHKGGFDPLVNDPALTDANEATLTVYLDAEACSGGLYYSFYCVVTDDAGAKVTTNTVSIKASHVYGSDRGENVTPKNAADALYKAAAYSYIDKSGKTRTVTAEASSGHRFPCLCELNWKTIHYKSKSPAMHTFGTPQRLGKSAKANALDTDLVYEQTCTGCGYVAYYETHTHVFRDENHHGYFGDFEVNEAKTTVLAHALNCLFEGCETVKMEQHEWNWRTVSYPSAGSNGGFYRECRICTYPDYEFRPVDDKGNKVNWTTDNIIITAERTQVSTSLAKVGEKITLTYNNESNVGVRCIGFSVTYTDPDGKKHDISPRFRYTQNEDGSLMTTVSTGGYKTGGVLYFEPWGERCKDHDYITVNYKPAVCMYEGYEGDVICKYCKSPSPDDTKTPEEKIIEAKSDHHTGKKIPLYYAADGKTATTDKSSGIRYGAKKGDCETRGYEGDYRCADCGRNIAGKWDFMHPSYAIEVKNERVVSCFKNGYSGDEFCERCGKTVSKGYVIQAPKEHTTHF